MSARRQATANRAAPPGAPQGGAGADASQPAAEPPRAAAGGQPLPTRVPGGRGTAGSRAAGNGTGRNGTGGNGTGGNGAASAAEAVAWATGADETQGELGLSARLMAMARMIQIGSARSGRDGFSKKLLADAEGVLGRAGERMRLSPSHTVVALAGGTGSGKSSLFNRMAGADFSTVGVTRPVTRDAHACIWDAPGSGALLDWLGVAARYRYARTSELDRAEDDDLAGLVLLDLPDHDSVMSHSGDRADRLVAMADVIVWVLDPQKYADAAVHRRFLVPMVGHAEVLVIVLNQADLLEPGQADDCVADLRRLLDSENLPDVPIQVTSAVTGAGMDGLRKLLVDAVAARRAATMRISADVDRVVARFGKFAGRGNGPKLAMPADSTELVAARFADAAGVQAMSDALRSARELRAADFVGWPVAWVTQRLTGRDPMRKVRLGLLWNELRSVSAGPAGAQQAEIDNTLTDFADKLGAALPRPWSQTVMAAVRSRADAIPAAVGKAMGEALPAEENVTWWWRLAGAWQGLLLGAAVVAVAWMAATVAFGVFHAASGVPTLFSDLVMLPVLAAAAIVALGLGAFTSRVCMSAVAKTAERENTQVATDMKRRIVGVAREMVIMPAEQELSEYRRYREELSVAGPAPR